MPFKSTSQRAWMFATHPQMAKRWAAHTPKGKKLPGHVHERAIDGATPEDNPGLPDPEEDGQEFVKTQPIHAVRMDKDFKVKTLEGPMKAKAGDWLAKGPEDELYPIDGKVFDKTYAPAGEKKMDKERDGSCEDKVKSEGPLDFIRSKLSGKEAPQPGRGLDLASLRDPDGFIDGVHKFVNGLERDIGTLKHFAQSHARRAEPEKKKTFQELERDFDELRTTVEPALAKVGKTSVAKPAPGGKSQEPPGVKTPTNGKAVPDEAPRYSPGPSPSAKKGPPAPKPPGPKTLPTVDLGKGKDEPMAKLVAKKPAVSDTAPRSNVYPLFPKGRDAKQMPAVKDEPPPERGHFAQNRVGLRRPFG